MNRLAIFAALAAALMFSGSAVAATSTPVMTGLDNPRGLAFGKNGALYVVQAGRGGAGPCQVLRGLVQCYGPTGRVSRLWHGVQSDVVTGLPSYVATEGLEIGSATGPHDLLLLGDSAMLTIGWGENPALRNTPPSAVWQQFGHLAFAMLTPPAKWLLGPDISAYEAAANPDNGPVDTNPYGLIDRIQGGFLLTDAGGNDLLRLGGGPTGISTVAVFPSRSTVPPHPGCAFPPGFGPVTDSVPTSVSLGPDGAYYVGELTGAPFCTGNANVYRVAQGQVSVYCGGFTTISDLTWGPDGQLYVLQYSNGPAFFATPGNVVRVGPGCSKTIVSPPLNRAGSLAFGPDGKLYVSINADAVGVGEVVRIDP